MIRTLKETFDKAFPERQIYHRSGGIAHYIVVGPWQQAIIAMAFSAAVGWTIFVTGSYVLGASYEVASDPINPYTDTLEQMLENALVDIEKKGAEIDELRRELSLPTSNENIESKFLNPTELQILLDKELTADQLRPAVNSILAEISTLREVNEKQQARMNQLDVKALDQVNNSYRYMKHTIATLEPDNGYTPDIYLDKYFSLVRYLIFGVSAGISAVLSLIITKFFSGFVQRKPS
tara:strand:- start:2345 stop:3052 length:708 start_codon:yes stop_codon:yes gene_type:complete